MQTTPSQAQYASHLEQVSVGGPLPSTGLDALALVAVAAGLAVFGLLARRFATHVPARD
jgi:hypothetical protein